MSKRPKNLYTHICFQCWFTSYSTELKKPECIFCGNNRNLVLLKKEPHTEAVVDRAVFDLNERLIELLERSLRRGEYGGAKDKNEIIESIKKKKELRDLMRRKILTEGGRMDVSQHPEL